MNANILKLHDCPHATIRALNGGICVLCTNRADPTDAALEDFSSLDSTVLERELQASLYRDSFADFASHFWPVVTGMPYEPNGATTAIIQALQNVSDGLTTRLLIAVPPGCGKTTLLALYAAWRLARDASWRSIHGSHAFDLAATESRRVRRLVESPEFQALYPVKLRADESTVAHWATTSDGRYFAVGTDSALTGRRGHEAVCDDPLNATDRFSKAARDGLWAWFTESLSTRLDRDNAPIIVVQQRLDRDDLIGRLIAMGGWTIVELPAEDAQGVLLAPNVLPRTKLDELRKQIGSAAYACQYLQRPSDDANAAIKRTWWRFHRPALVAETMPRPSGCNMDAPAARTPDTFDRVVIAVDMTFGSLKGDFAVAQVWGSVGASRFLLEQWRKQATQLEQIAAIKALARKYPEAKILIEKAAGGAGALEQLAANGIPNIVPVLTGGRGKSERLGVVSPTIEGGNAYLPLGAAWVADYVEELAGATRHDDAQDATAYALAELNTGVDLGAAILARHDAMLIAFGASVAGKRAGFNPYTARRGPPPVIAPLDTGDHDVNWDDEASAAAEIARADVALARRLAENKAEVDAINAADALEYGYEL